MKLATLKDETRDGCLTVVSRNLKFAIKADDIAPTLQAALVDWDYISPLLTTRYEELTALPSSRAFEFDTAQCMAPLPRAFQWLGSAAYLSHAERARKARGAELTEDMRRDPIMYQAASDAFVGARDDLCFDSDETGIDIEAAIAVITGDVPAGIRRERAGEHVLLVMLANDVKLRELVTTDLARGYGLLHGKPVSSFSPCVVTPDELGAAWDGRRLHRPLAVHVNDTLLGRPDAGTNMDFSFPRLIAHAAATRSLRAGSIIGSGSVANRDAAVGVTCLAEKRALEIIESGEARTPFLKFGDRVKIEMLDGDGNTLFGAIDQAISSTGAKAKPDASPEAE